MDCVKIGLILNFVGFLLLTAYSFIVGPKLVQNKNGAYQEEISGGTAKEPEKTFIDYIIGLRIDFWGFIFAVIGTLLQIIFM